MGVKESVVLSFISFVSGSFNPSIPYYIQGTHSAVVMVNSYFELFFT
jgi:hypothetical protein